MSLILREPARRLRVVHVVQNLNYGGMERLISDLALRVDPERHESHILALQYLGHFAEGLEGRVGLHLCPRQPRWSSLWPAGLTRVLRGLAPDVVHSHSGVWLKAVRAARCAEVPLVIHTEHGQGRPGSLSDRLIERLAASRTDVVVAVSDALAERMLMQRIGNHTQMRVVANGVDPNRFCVPPVPLHAELGVEPETPLIGSVGRLEPIKGYDVMVDAFAQLLSAWSGSAPPVLVLVGDGAEREALVDLAHRRGIAGRVRFLGWRDDIAGILPTLSLFTMSSRSEGTSVSLLEAMAAGLCPVVTDVGGNAAVLGEPLRHRLVPPLDPAGLAAAWMAALADPPALRADAAMARERVRTAWSVDAMVRRYEEIYACADGRVAMGRAAPVSTGA